MFAPPREVLKAKDGTLDETPFALLLHAIAAEERSCTLELKLRNLEKRVTFEDGVLVGCESNLLHESVGKSLVEKGKLTEEQHLSVLTECAATGKDFGALLVEKQLISAFELFKHLQASLGLRILDVFRWAGAKWRLLAAEEVLTPIRINVSRLIYTGVMQMPAEAIARHFPLPPAQRLALDPDAPMPQDELKLSPKELRLVNQLKQRATVGELLAAAGFTPEDVTRRLFALAVLRMVDLAERLDARPSKPPTSAPVPVAAPLASPPMPAPQQKPSVPLLDDDAKAIAKLAEEFLSCRQKDPFDLLGVPVAFDTAAFQKAFLAKADALSPVRFKGADARHKAEVLLVAYAKAFGALAEHESFLLHQKRREVAKAQKANGGPNPNAAAEQLRIRTQLLDADTQFKQGLQRLNAGNLKGAIEHLEYACDIEPRGRFLAYLAWARFQDSPTGYGLKALMELGDACARQPDCEEAWGFRGDVASALGRHDEAEGCYRSAQKLAPANKRYAEGIKRAAGAKR